MTKRICLGIEGTAEKTGVGLVTQNGKILASEGNPLIPEKGGIHPREAAEHHAKNIPLLIKKAVKTANINLNQIDLISFSKGPGLGPALRTVATAARTLALSLNVPIIGVNHCIGHIEIGKLTTGAKDPVTLYTSGGNSQVIAYEDGRYRVFGETLDIAIGNMLDQFSRNSGLGHPGGPKIEELSKNANKYIKLPYTVKGMDLSFSGLLTSAERKLEKGSNIEDVCYSLQETAFAMTVEVAERVLSHTKKNEVMLCGGVAANNRLREMVSIMAKEHYADFYIPPIKYCGDNGAMIAWMGQLIYDYNGSDLIEDTNVIQRYRTDQVDVPWMHNSNKKLKLPDYMMEKGAEANIYESSWLDEECIVKKRISKSYRINEIDVMLRKYRTKKEARLLSHVKDSGIKTPYLFDIDLDNYTITMQKIKGKSLKDILNTSPSNLIESICENIGKNIANMHKLEIIHGDLTSSNIIVDNNEIIFIDFGLGKYSNLIEDYGVDLLVLKKSLNSTNNSISEKYFENIIKGYKKTNPIKIDEKIKEIQDRGRYI